MTKTMYSCVVDQNPKSPHQALIWALSLLGYGGQQPESLVVHIVDECHPNHRSLFDSIGVNTVPIKPFDPLDTHSNKLAQLIDSEPLQSADYVVLCECDIAFCEDPSPAIKGNSIRATAGEGAPLSLDDWHRIFNDANLAFRTSGGESEFDNRAIVSAYCRGGLLVLTQSIHRNLRRVWPKWNQWLLGRPEILGPFGRFADQISFVLSLAELELEVDRLSDEFGFPTHVPLASSTTLKNRPRVIHYHDHLNESGFLLPTRISSVDLQIERINELIRKSRRRGFDNFAFWEFRYALHPGLGSGVGSRGDNLITKRDILKAQLDALRPASVLDVGCGDLEVMKDLTISNYTGLDISPSAVQLAAKKRPDWEFILGDILKADLAPKDIVIALDVVIHQPTLDMYSALCQRLLSLSGKHLIIAGYDQPPRYSSEITFYYERLSDTLSRLGPGHSENIGTYRDTTILRWSRA